MALDPMEKDLLRKRMALRMQVMAESSRWVECVSGHYQDEPAFCELCSQKHADELLVIRNRAGKKFHVAPGCLREMLRFQVVDVEGMPKWLEKLKELRIEFDKRKALLEQEREAERRRLEKKFITRKKREPNQIEKA